MISTYAEYVALLGYAQEVNFINILLEEITEVNIPSVMYKDNKGAILLAKNRQVGMHTKYIDISHRFPREMVEDKDMDIKYIRI